MKMKNEIIEEIVNIEDSVKEMFGFCNEGIIALKKVTELKELKYEITRFEGLMRQAMNLIDSEFFIVEEIMGDIK